MGRTLQRKGIMGRTLQQHQQGPRPSWAGYNRIVCYCDHHVIDLYKLWSRVGTNCLILIKQVSVSVNLWAPWLILWMSCYINSFRWSLGKEATAQCYHGKEATAAVASFPWSEFCVGRNGPSWAFWTGPGLFVGLPLRNYYIPIITFQEENYEPNLSILDQP